MKTFSQRKGLKPIAEVIQVNSMNDELRNSLWNVLDALLWSTDNYTYRQYGKPLIMGFSYAVWFNLFKLPADSRPDQGWEVLKVIRNYFFSCAWNEVYDFLEFVVDYHDSRKELPLALNHILERELSGYRFVSGHITDITNEQELSAIEEALKDSRFVGVTEHLNQALAHFSNREAPDYRNSIKESISAVESMARVVSGNEKATLGDALKILEKLGKLHPALKDGFGKLYGYTSDAQGIRHAMLDEATLTSADAKYFLVICSAFTNYLKSQVPVGT
jgi:hypothetical protein